MSEIHTMAEITSERMILQAEPGRPLDDWCREAMGIEASLFSVSCGASHIGDMLEWLRARCKTGVLLVGSHNSHGPTWHVELRGCEHYNGAAPFGNTVQKIGEGTSYPQTPQHALAQAVVAVEWNRRRKVAHFAGGGI